MQALNCRSWRGWAVLLLSLAGCRGLFGTHEPPHDPLFISKTPTSAKAERTPPVALAYLEPTAPRDPYAAANPPALADKDARPVQGTLTNRTKE